MNASSCEACGWAGVGMAKVPRACGEHLQFMRCVRSSLHCRLLQRRSRLALRVNSDGSVPFDTFPVCPRKPTWKRTSVDFTFVPISDITQPSARVHRERHEPDRLARPDQTVPRHRAMPHVGPDAAARAYAHKAIAHWAH